MPRNKGAYRTARRLRGRDGLSFKRIASELGISPATAHAWTRDIVLTPEQRARCRGGPTGPADREAVARRAESWRLKCRARREQYQAEGRACAIDGDLLHLAGCMLYWAEGAKSRNTLKLANSDAGLVALFCRFLREKLGVENDQVRLSLNVYLAPDRAIEDVERYWLDALELPSTCLRKHTINARPTSSSGLKKDKLPYGVATVRVHSTQLVQHVYGAIQAYAGFESPAWLD
ncbi:MAG TPA: hypothetical protein VD790_08710 [Thermoleophilaceae bacterium]|nr:hypothetical protein [Thermoleophilaceae bacterium]